MKIINKKLKNNTLFFLKYTYLKKDESITGNNKIKQIINKTRKYKNMIKNINNNDLIAYFK